MAPPSGAFMLPSHTLCVYATNSLRTYKGKFGEAYSEHEVDN